MSFVVAQISDTHLSADRPYFVENFSALASHLRDARCDLVINTGDITIDGADSLRDLEAARAWHDGLGCEWLAIPGNHDIGDSQEITPRQPIADMRRIRYCEVFGADWWSIDVPGWRLIGINAQLLGSDLMAAREQDSFIAAAAAGADGSSIALFVHKPLFDTDPTEEAVTHRFINPAPRHRLLGGLQAGRLQLIASGHVHQYRSVSLGGVAHVWAPSTAFVLPESMQPTYGRKTVGYIEHRFEADGSVVTRLVEPAAMDCIDLSDVPGAYGDVRARTGRADMRDRSSSG